MWRLGKNEILTATLSIAGLLITPSALAEEFLGIEEPAPSKSKAVSVPKTESEPPDMHDEGADEPVAATAKSSTSGSWSGSAALWPGLDRFSANLSVHYHFNRYLGIDTIGRYGQTMTESYQSQMYGPDVYFVVRLANPTIATPLGGLGVGFDRWRRIENDELFSDGGSMTGLGYVGVNVALTKHFGFQVVRRQKIYLDDPPATFANHSEKEPRSQIHNEVGFLLIF